MPIEVRHPRLVIGFAIALIVWLALEIKLLKIQVLNSEEYRNLASKQQYHRIPLTAERGGIFDSKGYQLALNIEAIDIIANGRQIKNRDEFIDKASTLGIDKEILKTKLNPQKGYIPLLKSQPPQRESDVRKLKTEGLYVLKSAKRHYPLQNIGKHIIGFLNDENKGTGIEASCDMILRGIDGWRMVRFNGRGEPFSSVGLEEKLPKPGYNIYLTIDKDIQTIVEDELAKGVDENKARNGFAIVVKVKTGEILAMASYPTINLEGTEDEDNNWLNRPVNEIFEPGSIFKIFIAAGLLDKEKITESTPINCLGGKISIGDYFTVYDCHKMHTVPFREVIVNSSNVGTIQCSKRLTKEELYEIYKKFGFGQRTGIPLPGEQKGYFIHPDLWSGVTKYSMSIGYGISVTGLQLVMGASAIANNGRLMAPILVSRIEDADGHVIQRFNPVVVRQVVSREATRVLLSIMEDVVKRGTGKKAAIKETTIAGKTSTAKKVEKGGKKYTTKQYKSAFIGFFPSQCPVYAILVVIDEPRGHFIFGGDVSAPIFGAMAQKMLAVRGNIREIIKQ